MSKLETHKKSIWSRVQRECGYRVPLNVKESIEEHVGDIDDYTCPDLETGLNDYEDYIRDYIGLAKLIAKGSYLTPLNKQKTQSRKRYQRPFKKRLHLVEFIISRQLSLRRLRHASSTPRRRINWKWICEEWNKDHPYDIMTPAVIKATYYRAMSDIDVQKELFLKPVEEILLCLEDRERYILQLRSGFGGGRPMTRKEAAEELKLTPGHILKIESIAVRKLRHPSRSRKLWDLIQSRKDMKKDSSDDTYNDDRYNIIGMLEKAAKIFHAENRGGTK